MIIFWLEQIPIATLQAVNKLVSNVGASKSASFNVQKTVEVNHG